MRWVRARVLPDPAPATIRTGPSVCRTASACTGFKASTRGERTATAPIVGGPRTDLAERPRMAHKVARVLKEPDRNCDTSRDGRDRDPRGQRRPGSAGPPPAEPQRQG